VEALARFSSAKLGLNCEVCCVLEGRRCDRWADLARSTFLHHKRSSRFDSQRRPLEGSFHARFLPMICVLCRLKIAIYRPSHTMPLSLAIMGGCALRSKRVHENLPYLDVTNHVMKNPQLMHVQLKRFSRPFQTQRRCWEAYISHPCHSAWSNGAIRLKNAHRLWSLAFVNIASKGSSLQKPPLEEASPQTREGCLVLHIGLRRLLKSSHGVCDRLRGRVRALSYALWRDEMQSS
jgi:hypothetical protein